MALLVLIVALIAVFLLLWRIPVIGMVLFGISAFCALLAAIDTTWRIRDMMNAGLNPSMKLPAIEVGVTIVCGLLAWLYAVLTVSDERLSR